MCVRRSIPEPGQVRRVRRCRNPKCPGLLVSIERPATMAPDTCVTELGTCIEILENARETLRRNGGA